MRGTFCLLGTLLAFGCQQGAAESYAQLPRLNTALEQLDIAVAVAPAEVAKLAYQTPPVQCAQVYRISIDNEPDVMHEDDSESFLSLGHPIPAAQAVERAAGPLADGEVFVANVYFKGIRAERLGVLREGYLSALHAGPSSPTAGCLPQTWDPVEDTMTLGWPKLTGRLTGVGERWTGLRVSGKCNRAACVDPQTGGGGEANHDRTCVTQDWQNQLVGLFEKDDQQLALIRSTWTDGHGEPTPANTTGIWGERYALISLDHGRPVWAKHTLHHSFPRPTADKSWAPIDRTWEMQSVDECPGSLASLGWTRPTAFEDTVQTHRMALEDPDFIREQLRKKPTAPTPAAPAPAPAPAPAGEVAPGQAPDQPPAQPYIVPVPKPE